MKKKIILAFTLGVLASGIVAYAAILTAADIEYKDGKKVEDALNELYTREIGVSDDISAKTITADSESITIQISTSENLTIDIIGYFVIANEKVFTSETNQIVISNLTGNTQYEVVTGIIKKDYTIIKSKPQILETSDGKFLYNNGSISNDLGNLIKTGNNNQLLVDDGNKLRAYHTTNGSFSNSIYYYSNAITLSEYKSITFELKATEKRAFAIGISGNKPNWNDPTTDAKALESFTGTNAAVNVSATGNMQKVTIDISGLNSGYIVFSMFDTSAEIYSIYLSK